MRISANYTTFYWFDLELLDENSESWEDGIKVIEDRFNSRFFSQIDEIKDNEFSGFIIMSIDCLLIETLMQFYLGVKDTETYYQGKQREAFRDFFRNSPNFKDEFINNDICFTFHNHFRNGLLHQAQTKRKSLIRICKEKTLQLFDEENVNKGLVIDREKFHEKLHKEFQDYIHKLKDNGTNFKNENLRLNAIKKMGFICKEV